MLVKSALTACLAATAAQAFLIPSDMLPSIKHSASSLPDIPRPLSSKQPVELDCPGCPVRLEPANPKPALEAALRTGEPVSSHLDMTFSIQSTPHGDSLLVNGFELYPNPDPFTNPLEAAQVFDTPGLGDLEPTTWSLGYKLEAYSFSHPVTEKLREAFDGQLETIRVELKVIELGGVFVSRIPTVEVELFKLGDRLSFVTIMTVGQPSDGAECTTILCKLKAMFSKQMSKFRKPCAGGKGMGHGQMGHGHPHNNPHHGQDNSQQASQFSQYKAHAHRFSVSRAITMVLTHFIVPIILGIFAGLCVSIIGMVVITTITRIVSCFRSKKAQAPPPYKADASEAVVVDEEKDGLMDNQEEHPDPPPSYPEDTSAPRV